MSHQLSKMILLCQLPKCLHTVLDETGLTLDNLDWVVCHQANSRIIDHCVKALHADGAKFYKNMDRHGNTSAASIPVALNELAAARGQTLAQMALSWVLKDSGVTSVLIGASRPQQIVENAAIVNAAPFTQQELDEIERIAAVQ